MDAKVFAAELARSLARRGIPKEAAVKHAVSLVRTFDEDDLREISSYTSPEDFAELSDRLSDFIKEKDNGVSTVNDEDGDMKIAPSHIPTKKSNNISAMAGDTVTVPVVSKAAPEGMADNMKTKVISLKKDEEHAEDGQQTRTFEGIKTADIAIDKEALSSDTCINIPVSTEGDDLQESEVYLEEETENKEEKEEKIVLTKRGRAYFVSISIISSPVVLLGSLLVLLVFGLGILTLGALIVATLALVCCEAIAGSIVTIVGIIYGAIRLVSGGIGEGLFEIGLGVSLGGLALALGILTFNLATVALPYAFKQLIAFEGYCFRRVKPMINRFREECNRL